MATNLPTNPEINDSASKTKQLFNEYGQLGYEFNAFEVDATIAFFEKRKFSKAAAEATAVLLLTQAKIEKVSVMSILDTIKKTDEVELSAFVSKIINRDRVQTSVLGFRTEVTVSNQARNIVE